MCGVVRGLLDSLRAAAPVTDVVLGGGNCARWRRRVPAVAEVVDALRSVGDVIEVSALLAQELVAAVPT